MNTTSEKQAVTVEMMAASGQLVDDAEAAMAWEHALTPRRAVKLYSRAMWYGAIVSLILVMEGFDTKVMGSLYAVPEFAKAYGSRQRDGSYQISAAWQSGMSGINGTTQMLGMFLGGYVTEKFGFRKTMLATMISIPPIVFAFFFAPNIQVLAVANFLFSWPLGIFQTMTTVYVTDIMPTALRPYLTSCYSLSYALGQLLNAVVFRGTLTLPSPWTYRVPFALQWFWPLPLIGGLWTCPESPWWLVRQNRIDEAEVVVSRLVSKDIDIDVKKLVSLMVFTTNHERNVENRTSYWACFKGTNLRRTLIVQGVYIMQVLTGAPLRGWMTYFFQQGGLPTDQSFNMTIVALVLGLAGVLCAWLVMTYVGRRTMYIWGNIISIVLFTAIGGMGIAMRKSAAGTKLGWGVGSLLAVDAFVANLLVLPITFVLVSEIPSSLLRSKSVVIARGTYTVINILVGVIIPYMLNPSAWNWGAITGFFWAGACVIGFIFTWFMVPETKGRTTAEVDILFEQNVGVRSFKDAKVSLAEIEDVKSA